MVTWVLRLHSSDIEVVHHPFYLLSERLAAHESTEILFQILVFAAVLQGLLSVVRIGSTRACCC